MNKPLHVVWEPKRLWACHSEEEEFKVCKFIFITVGAEDPLFKMLFEREMEREEGWGLELGIKDNSDSLLRRETWVTTRRGGPPYPFILILYLEHCWKVYIRKYRGGSNLPLPSFKVLSAGLISKETWNRLARVNEQFNYVHMYGNLTYITESKTPHTWEVPRQKGKTR